ncbi:fused MFS/spermidine synthase [Cupriavidus sp. 30B13]|uniref:fused MFS/spermidine synthase n=1 Tax=Cupriavidus sp. 30B13 TaxID=3384241 RepID=UPI003B920E02
MLNSHVARGGRKHGKRGEPARGGIAGHGLPRAQAPAATAQAWPALLLLASGAAGLVFQVLWIKQLTLVEGVEVHAVTVAVSAFFGGLALGGWLFGRAADRSACPLRLYAWLELAVMVLALASTAGLSAAAAPFAWLEDRAGLLAWALPVLLAGTPAVAMGGTLPVLMRALAPAHGMGAHGGRLYAANTAGAIAGTLLAGFALVPWLGVLGSACAAAALNGAAGGAALVLARGAGAAPGPAAPQAALPLPGRRLALALYAIAGGIALGYEVVWSQAIVQFISTRSFAFSVVLATYLCGLAAGSALMARRADRVRDPWGVFAALIAGAGLVALLEIVWLGAWLPRWQAQAAAWLLAAGASQLAAMCARFAVAALWVVFVPTLLLGAAFPLMLRIAVDRRRVGRDVGAVVALNTVGGIAGSAIAGFGLVPLLGLVHALAALALAACAVALAAAWAGRGTGHPARAGAALLAVAALAAALLAPPDRLAVLLARARGGELVFYEESRGATVAVVEQGAGQNRFRRLYIQGVSNSGDAMASLRYMRLQTLLPLIIHRGTPRSALVIGLGTGITAGAMLAYPGLERRVVAELLPAVARAVPQFAGNYGVGADARVQVRLRDGRRELLQSPQRYDLITLEPPPPSAAGVVNLYSTDFYRLAAARLQPSGLVAQWLPLPTQNDEDTRALVRSFLDAFPYATLWTTELHEMMLVGSAAPIELDAARIAQRFAQPEVGAALRAVGIASPAALMATWVTGREGLERYAGDARAVTDDRPRIEYAQWVRRADFPLVLEHLLALRTEAPLSGADDGLRRAIAAERQNLLTFYGAGLDAYRGDREQWSRDISEVMRADPGNPYYNWFAGGRPGPAQ